MWRGKRRPSAALIKEIDRQAWPENAQAGDAVARDAGRADAHAVGRCSGGVVSARDRAGAHGAYLH